MVLSNIEIHKALKSARLKITPKPSPEFPSGAAKCPYDTTAVDLRLG